MRWRQNSESWVQLWEDAAKEHGGCTVESESILHDRQVGGAKEKDNSWGQLDRSKIIGLREEGFRWMVWWTKVEFQESY